MAYYAFYQDRKVTCWERTHFDVQADTYEEALAIIKSWGGEDVALWEEEEKVSSQTALPSMKRAKPYLPRITTDKPRLKSLTSVARPSQTTQT